MNQEAVGLITDAMEMLDKAKALLTGEKVSPEKSIGDKLRVLPLLSELKAMKKGELVAQAAALGFRFEPKTRVPNMRKLLGVLIGAYEADLDYDPTLEEAEAAGKLIGVELENADLTFLLSEISARVGEILADGREVEKPEEEDDEKEDPTGNGSGEVQGGDTKEDEDQEDEKDGEPEGDDQEDEEDGDPGQDDEEEEDPAEAGSGDDQEDEEEDDDEEEEEDDEEDDVRLAFDWSSFLDLAKAMVGDDFSDSLEEAREWWVPKLPALIQEELNGMSDKDVVIRFEAAFYDDSGIRHDWGEGYLHNGCGFANGLPLDTYEGDATFTWKGDDQEGPVDADFVGVTEGPDGFQYFMIFPNGDILEVVPTE